MTKVAVIIPSLYEKDKEYLKLCVESLRATVDWQIIVVTNGSSAKPDLRHIKGISQHLHTRDQGQCIAVNIGAQVVNPSTEYIMVSNSDMYYAPNWLDGYDVGSYPVWSPNLIEPEEVSSAAPFLKFDGGSGLEGFKRQSTDEFVINHPTEQSTTGFNLPFFIKREIWQTIGGYDTKYDPWGSNSDTDLQTKIELAGIQPMRVRDVLVYHFGSKSETFTPDKQPFWQKNWDYYTAKWGFNRDMEPKPDTWMATNLVNKKLNRYHPSWEGKYKDA